MWKKYISVVLLSPLLLGVCVLLLQVHVPLTYFRNPKKMVVISSDAWVLSDKLNFIPKNAYGLTRTRIHITKEKHSNPL